MRSPVCSLVNAVVAYAAVVQPLGTRHAYAATAQPHRVRPCVMSAASSDDSNLEQALSTMDVAEQYQTVLRSMVSSSQSSRATSLVAEMTSRGIPLKDDSLRALLDGALDDDAQLPSLLAALRACKQNGALRAFGDASCWSAPERPLGLESLPPLP